MKITLIQPNLFWENKEKNLASLKEMILKDSTPTDLIILPEMFSTGFTMNAKTYAEKMDGPSIKWMSELAKEKKCAVTGSLILEDSGNFYNRLIWMNSTGHLSYDKRHLFSYAKEDETYTAGNKKLIVELNGWKICPLICYDLRFPVWSRRTNEENYDLLIFVANWPERRNLAWKTLLPARAVENQSYVVGVNRIGDDGNNIYHSGDSAAYNFKGELITKILPDKESIETIELNIEELHEFRKQFAFANDADRFKIG